MCRLHSCGFRQLAGRDGVPLPLLVDRSLYGVVRVSRPPPSSGYLPGQSSVLADLLSRRDQVMGTAWSFHLPVVTALLRAWGFPLFDLFAMGLPAVLPLFCSLVPNRRVALLDAFRVHWAALGLYAFRPSFRRMGDGSSR